MGPRVGRCPRHGSPVRLPGLNRERRANGPDGRAANKSPSPGRHVLRPPGARTAARPSAPAKNGNGERGGSPRTDGTAQSRRPRAADARSAKVTPQGALLPARAPARCQALARPSPGSAVMKEIKVPTTTRAHCAQL